MISVLPVGAMNVTGLPSPERYRVMRAVGSACTRGRRLSAGVAMHCYESSRWQLALAGESPGASSKTVMP